MKLRTCLTAALFLSFSTTWVLAGDKAVPIETIPPGAQVEVNGSVTCTTPCSIKVPGYYFGKKRTAFSSHGIEPIRLRLTRDGYVPKAVEITVGPIHWHNLYGNNLYDYYLVTAEHFKFQLDAVQDFVPLPTAASSPSASAVSQPALAPVEDVVRQTLPAVVTVSTPTKSGSGFFVTPDGVVVTNAHVVQGESSATVIMSSGRSLQSSHIYVDENRDLALVKVDIKGNPFLKLGLVPPAPGSEVIAIGTPGANDATGTLMLPNTVTKGVVSGIRTFPEDTTTSVPGREGLWIQTDATINHGNSGGPLLNRSGEVVGINTLAFTATGTPGLNFALSSTELAAMLRNRFGFQPPADITPTIPQTPVQAASTTSGSTSAASTVTVVSLASNPSGADIEVDGAFLGSTPADLPLTVGQRKVTISKKGFKTYERTIEVLGGSSQRISVDLEHE